MSSQETEVPLNSSRYILVQIGQNTVAFPEEVVVEIVSLDRTAILQLPFYDSRVLGVAHFRGHLMPLCSLNHQQVLPFNASKEALTAIRLNERAGESAGVGVVVNKILGKVQANQLNTVNSSDEADRAGQPHIFSCDELSISLWQLQRSSAEMAAFP